MKKILSLTFVAILVAPVLAKYPTRVPKNESRNAVEKYHREITDLIHDDDVVSTKTKPKTSLPQPSLTLNQDLPSWHTEWTVAKDGTAMLVHFKPEDGKVLEYGMVRIYIYTKPFTAQLKEAPNVLDEGISMRDQVIHFVPQKWVSYNIPSLKLKVRGYLDSQSGGADGPTESTEPFKLKTADGKSYWIYVHADGGFHETKGINLKMVLDALKF